MPQQNLLLPTREIMSKKCLSFTLALFKGIVTVLVAFILLTQKSYSKITIHKNNNNEYIGSAPNNFSLSSLNPDKSLGFPRSLDIQYREGRRGSFKPPPPMSAPFTEC